MIKEERRDNVVWLKLDQPPVNVLTIALLEELASRVKALGSDDRTGALFLSGEGKVFSAGASVEEHRPEQAPEMLQALERACRALENAPFPTVALLHGNCLGGALELAASCDFLVADPAAQMGVPEIKLAFFPPLACARLPLLIGRANTAYLVFTGESISAETALQWGLVQQIMPQDEWPKLAERFNRLSRPVLRLAKRALGAAALPEPAGAREAAVHLFLEELYRVEDVQEGIQSFMEKRRPEWKHR